MYRERDSVTQYLNDKKTHAVISSEHFKRSAHINEQLYELQLLNSEIKHQKPTRLGFFNCKLRNWESWRPILTIFLKICKTDNYKNMEMDRDFLLLTLTEDTYVAVSEKKKNCKNANCCQAKSMKIPTLQALAITSSSVYYIWCTQPKKRQKRKKYSKFQWSWTSCLRSTAYVWCNSCSNKSKLSRKGLIKRIFHDSGYGPISNGRRILMETEKITSPNCGLRTMIHSIAT